ncbi:hypothetical protein ACJ65_10515 [Kocuria rhizophila]|nr:hypothetical protein ACJ65_10515 [Kocuria rhizophila]
MAEPGPAASCAAASRGSADEARAADGVRCVADSRSAASPSWARCSSRARRRRSTDARSSSVAGPVATGRRALWEMASRMATMIQLESRDEPPADMNGVVSPVSGSRRVTPPTTMNSCSTISADSPPASSLPNASRVPSAARRPREAKSRNITRMAESPIRPSSSPNAVMIMSELAYETRSGRPCPSPWPKSPPEARPKSPCTIWAEPPGERV